MKKIALITGASRGIGAALAKEFARAGYHLALCCHHSTDLLEALSQKLQKQYRIRTLCFGGDVGDYRFVREMVDQTLATFGQIDVLMNNAGISYIGLLTDMEITDWNRIVATNLTSVFSTCRCVVPSMVAAKSGQIINISSVWGNVGASCEVAYSACKGGINSFTRALGKELAPSNIQVNAIACGMIDTDMNRCFSEEERLALVDEIPAGRMGTPEEVAAFALSLTKAGAYVNGQVLSFDGGWI
jgi:3-oxoacyl-[acyl-carrier protein] reductase